MNLLGLGVEGVGFGVLRLGVQGRVSTRYRACNN